LVPDLKFVSGDMAKDGRQGKGQACPDPKMPTSLSL
jgi:hypothetical protein